MAEHGHARVDGDLLLDAFGDVEGAACALRHDDHEMGKAIQTRGADLFDDLCVEIALVFGNQQRGRADGKTDVQRQMTGVAAHDLDYGAALVRLHRVAQLVDALDGGVGSGIKADAVVGAGNVVVDRAGNADDGNAVL